VRQRETGVEGCTLTLAAIVSGARSAFVTGRVSSTRIFAHCHIIDLIADQLGGEHHDVWGDQAAAAWVLSVDNPGYHRSKSGRNVPSSARVRVCSSRCAPRFVHCICWRLANRLLMTAYCGLGQA
jgi:hypothetical protein